MVYLQKRINLRAVNSTLYNISHYQVLRLKIFLFLAGSIMADACYSRGGEEFCLILRKSCTPKCILENVDFLYYLKSLMRSRRNEFKKCLLTVKEKNGVIDGVSAAILDGVLFVLCIAGFSSCMMKWYPCRVVRLLVSELLLLLLYILRRPDCWLAFLVISIIITISTSQKWMEFSRQLLHNNLLVLVILERAHVSFGFCI